ncbi:MAG: hypothetical protein HN341_11575 [Verrucomicrobia bacterium]|jgi:hypothetical protein|nr:hypothetical protein [Verrucomicrobiota bacterium]
MWNNPDEPEETTLEDHGDTYLCRHCDHEGLKATFGMNIQCPVCGSSDIVCAEFWRRFKKLHASGTDERTAGGGESKNLGGLT